MAVNNNKKEAAKNYKGLADEAQIKAWKNEYKLGIFGLVIGGSVAYFAYPNRHEINAAISDADTDNPMAAYEALAESQFIGGDKELIEGDRYYWAIHSKIKSELEADEAEVINF